MQIKFKLEFKRHFHIDSERHTILILNELQRQG